MPFSLCEMAAGELPGAERRLAEGRIRLDKLCMLVAETDRKRLEVPQTPSGFFCSAEGRSCSAQSGGWRLPGIPGWTGLAAAGTITRSTPYNLILNTT
jgi:hypothetical protein